jgi:hypothetical protein
MTIEDGNLTKEDAFLVGYLAGDATFRLSKRLLASGDYSIHPRLYISDTCDLDILLWIADNYPNSGIKTRERMIKGKNRISHTLYFPKSFMVHFEKYGLFHPKEHREIKNVPSKLFLYYLQGLALADGCVYIRHRNDCVTPRLNFCIAHQSYPLFNFIKLALNEKYDYPVKLKTRKNENVIYLDCQHTQQNKDFLTKLFVDTHPIVNHKKILDFNKYMLEYA